MQVQMAREIKERNWSQLMQKQNVVACGLGYKQSGGQETDELSLIVSVTKKLPIAQLAATDMVPQALDDLPTDVQEVGVIRAFQSPTDKWRPAPGGVSIGHVDVTAGTLGCLVYRGQELLILSNNHVLANCNRGRVGDAILQPGRQDGGTLNDQIATLLEFIPLDFGQAPSSCGVANSVSTAFNAIAQAFGSQHRMNAFQQTAGQNAVDVALARPLSPSLVEKNILNIGQPRGAGTATLGTQVVKSGRTTGFTSGKITQIDVTVQVEYPGVGTAVFSNQLAASGMSKPGDSGSAILDVNSRIVGLLFAGSDTATMLTPIQSIMSALNVTIA
jgi:hypothetical protein